MALCNYRPVVISMLAGLLLPACTSVPVKSDYDQEAAFAEYHTVAWLPRDKDLAVSKSLRSLVDVRIKRAIRRTLEAKGHRFIEQGAPDLYVTYHLAIRDRTTVTPEHYSGFGQTPGATLNIQTYREGTLVIDLIDRAEQHLVWRGWAVGAVARSDQMEEQIKAVVAHILSRYPPPQVSTPMTQ